MTDYFEKEFNTVLVSIVELVRGIKLQFESNTDNTSLIKNLLSQIDTLLQKYETAKAHSINMPHKNLRAIVELKRNMLAGLLASLKKEDRKAIAKTINTLLE